MSFLSKRLRSKAQILLDAAEILEKQITTGMTVVVRDVPGGYDWGFFSQEDARLHLQNINPDKVGKCKFWLESKGKRCFKTASSVDKFPSKVVKKLETYVSTHREDIEDEWVGLMIMKGCITFDYKNPILIIKVYPETHNEFVRVFDVGSEMLPEFRDRFLVNGNRDFKIDYSSRALVFPVGKPENEQIHVRLSRLIFKD